MTAITITECRVQTNIAGVKCVRKLQVKKLKTEHFCALIQPSLQVGTDPCSSISVPLPVPWRAEERSEAVMTGVACAHGHCVPHRLGVGIPDRCPPLPQSTGEEPKGPAQAPALPAEVRHSGAWLAGRGAWPQLRGLCSLGHARGVQEVKGKPGKVTRTA